MWICNLRHSLLSIHLVYFLVSFHYFFMDVFCADESFLGTCSSSYLLGPKSRIPKSVRPLTKLNASITLQNTVVDGSRQTEAWILNMGRRNDWGRKLQYRKTTYVSFGSDDGWYFVLIYFLLCLTYFYSAGNPFPPLEKKNSSHNWIHNILLEEAHQEYIRKKLKEEQGSN